MSSAVQTTSVLSHGSRPSVATATYTIEMMRALAPTIDAIKEFMSKDKQPYEIVGVNAQLQKIQIALGEANRRIEAALPASILREGSENPHFLAINQRPQGSWIKDTRALIVDLYEKIRREHYLEKRDSFELRDEIVQLDTPESLSLPRLMRAFGKSSFFTRLQLQAPHHRAELGITADLNQHPFREYLQNSSNRV